MYSANIVPEIFNYSTNFCNPLSKSKLTSIPFLDIKENSTISNIMGYYNIYNNTKLLTGCLKRGAKINIHDKNYVDAFVACKGSFNESTLITIPELG